MNYFELLSTEKDYYDKLTETERRVYIADNKQLATFLAHNHPTVATFVDVSRLLNEMHRLHQRFNDNIEFVIDKQNATVEDKKQFESMYDVNEELFSSSMSIGSFSAVFFLSCMDECDALYRYLAEVKMLRFDWMCDNIDVELLL